MGNIQLSIGADPSHAIAKVIGGVDEDMDFPDFQSGNLKKIEFDFSEVSGINSLGISRWIKMLEGLSSDCAVLYLNCPRMIIEQVNMVRGFLPASGKVESMLVPYYCDDCDHEFTYRISSPPDISEQVADIGESLNCPKCGEDADMDVFKEKFFRFAK